jgi:enamine deaminase RidA (YjgF/YER057c/UK114 family)
MGEPRAIEAPGIPGPVPGLFSNAVACDGVLYISGQHAGGPGGVSGEGMYAQAREALRRVVALVEAAGGSAERIVKLTIFVTDIARKDEVGRARREVFGADPLPAATMMEVSAFIDPALLVEIEAVAHLPSSPTE